MTSASKENQEWLVYITTPDNFLAWTRAEKVRFYEKVVEWHEYIEHLEERGYVERAYGSQKILGEQSTPITTKTVLVAKFKASPMPQQWRYVSPRSTGTCTPSTL